MFNKIKKLFLAGRRKESDSWNVVFPKFEAINRSKDLFKPFSYQNAVEVYRTNSIVAGCVNLNAKTVSSIPMKLFVYTGGRTFKEMEKSKLFKIKKIDRNTHAFLSGDLSTQPSYNVHKKYIDYSGSFVEVEGRHPVLELLSKGAARYRQSITNGVSQTHARLVDLQVIGSYYLQVTRDKMGIPIDLWNVPAQYMEIVPYETNTDKLIKKYRWGDGDKKVNLDPDDIIHARFYNPSDLYNGQSLVEQCWNAINFLSYFDQYSVSTFANAGHPLLTAKLDGANEDTINRFEKLYKKKMRGMKSVGGMIAHNNDIEFKSLSVNLFDKSLAQVYEDKVTEVAFTFSVPISKIRSNDSNLASAFVNDQAWHKDCIQHLCKYDENTLNEGLVQGMFGLEDQFLSYIDIIRKDAEKIENRLVTLMQAGIISKQKVRSELGYDEEDAPEVPDQLKNFAQNEENEEGEEGERKPRGSNFEKDEEKKSEQNENEEK